MIGKRVHSDRTRAKATSIRDLTNYVIAANENEKILAKGARGFVCDDFPEQQAEMIALAHEAVRSKNPVTHYVISWHSDEHPTREQAEEAISIYMAALGLEGHQVIWGLHQDTDNIHLHLAVNRVHPDTGRVVEINKGFDKNAIHQAIARIEHAQGWRPEKNGRYMVDDSGKVMRRKKQKTAEQPSPGLSQPAANMEHRTGTKSAERTAQEEAAIILESAKSWREVHEQLDAKGMRYERQGSGAIVWVGDQPVKASQVSRKGSIAKMQSRLGVYEAAGATPNVYIKHKPASEKPYPGPTGELSGYRMRRLSECGLAPDHEARKKPARILSFIPRVGGRTDEDLRRPDNLPRIAAQSIKGIEATRARYNIERAEYNRSRRANKEVLEIRHQTEREQFREQQRQRRDNILNNKDWRGMGDERNAMASVLAAEQAQERAAEQERQRVEKQQLAEENPPFPGFEKWLVEQGRAQEAEEWQARLARARAAEPDGFAGPAATYIPPTPPKDIRAFEPRVQNDNEVVYTRQHEQAPAFTDLGAKIEMQDTQPDSTLAALQLAQAKWGSVTITGSSAFKSECVQLAVANGIPINNPELKSLIEHERQRLADVFPATPAPPKAEAPAREPEPEKRQEQQRQHDHVPPQQQPEQKQQPKSRQEELELERSKLIAEIDQLSRDMQSHSMTDFMAAMRPLRERVDDIDAELDRLNPPSAQAVDNDPDWDIRAEAAAQAHDDDQVPPAPAPEQPKKSELEKLEDRRTALVMQIDALATKEMPIDERFERTRKLSAKITEVEGIIEKAKDIESRIIRGETDKTINGLTLGAKPASYDGRVFISATDAAGKERYLPYHNSIVHLHGKSVDVQISGGNFTVSEIKTHNNAMNKPTPQIAPAQQPVITPSLKKGPSM